jgi:hypothetical protein
MFDSLSRSCDIQSSKRENKPMVAYLHKTGAGYQLTIVARPCNGEEYQNGEKVIVAGKREARALCKARNIKPYNF